ncbi:MAG: hypothetical protein ABJA66_05500, partial [Actinomycetota bacterium]
MSLQTLDLPNIEDNFAPLSNGCWSENERNFFEALKRFAEPFAFWSDASFVYFSPSGESFAVAGEICQCSQYGAASPGKLSPRNHLARQV